jgi:hypothetical protein
LSPLKQSLLPISDHRRAQGKLYDLPHLLLFSILAVMSGATSYRRIHPFIRYPSGAVERGVRLPLATDARL